jgi:hypothetical protein
MIYYFFRLPNATATPPRANRESEEGSGTEIVVRRVPVFTASVEADPQYNSRVITKSVSIQLPVSKKCPLIDSPARKSFLNFMGRQEKGSREIDASLFDVLSNSCMPEKPRVYVIKAGE